MKREFQRIRNTATSLILASSMVLGSAATVFATGAEVESEPKEINYVSYGDSMTNGFGLKGYDSPAKGQNGYLDYGYQSYANQFAAYLAGSDWETDTANQDSAFVTVFNGEKATVNHTQLATSAMRLEDLLFALSYDWEGANHSFGMTREEYDKLGKGDYFTWNEFVDGRFGDNLSGWYDAYSLAYYCTACEKSFGGWNHEGNAKRENDLCIHVKSGPNGEINPNALEDADVLTWLHDADAYETIPRDDSRVPTYKYIIPYNGSNDPEGETANEWGSVWFGNGAAASAAQFQTATADADIISIGAGNCNFGVFLLGRMISAFNMLPGFGQNDYCTKQDENGNPLPGQWIYDISNYSYADLKATVTDPVILGIANQAEAMIGEYMGKPAGYQIPAKEGDEVDAAINIMLYTTLGFMVGYREVLDRIAELNHDADVMIVGLMNAFSSMEMVLNDANETKVNLQHLFEDLFGLLNTYLAGLASTLKDIDADHAEMTYYFAACPTVDVLANVYADEIDGENVLRDRFIEDITDKVFYMMKDMLAKMGYDVNEQITRADVDNYIKFNAAWEEYEAGKRAVPTIGEFSLQSGTYTDEDKNVFYYPTYNKLMLCAIYKAFEDAIIAGGETGVMYLGAIEETNKGFDAIFSTIGTAVGTNLGDPQTEGTVRAAKFAEAWYNSEDATEFQKQTYDYVVEAQTEANGELVAKVIAYGVATETFRDPTAFITEYANAYAATKLNSILYTAMTDTESESGELFPTLLNMFGRMVIGNGMGQHPSPAGHNDLSETVIASYGSYTAENRLEDQIPALLDTLYKTLNSDDEYVVDPDDIDVITLLCNMLKEYDVLGAAEKKIVMTVLGIYNGLDTKELISDSQTVDIIVCIFYAWLNDYTLNVTEFKQIAKYTYDVLKDGIATRPTFDNTLNSATINRAAPATAGSSLPAADMIKVIGIIYDTIKYNEYFEGNSEVVNLGNAYFELISEGIVNEESALDIFESAFEVLVDTSASAPAGEDIVKEVTEKVVETIKIDTSISTENKISIAQKFASAVIPESDEGDAGISSETLKYLDYLKAVFNALEEKDRLTEQESSEIIFSVLEGFMNGNDVEEILESVETKLLVKEGYTNEDRAEVMAIIAEVLFNEALADGTIAKTLQNAYAEAYAKAEAEGYIDEAKALLAAADTAVEDILAKVAALNVEELAEVKALLAENLNNARDVIAKLEDLLEKDDLTDDDVKAIFEYAAELPKYADDIAALADKMAIVEEVALEQLATASKYVSDMVDTILEEAYDFAIDANKEVKNTYLAWVETVVAAAEKIDAELADAVEEYLTTVPAEGMNLLFTAGAEAVDKVILFASAASGEIEPIITALSAALESDIPAIYNAVADSAEVQALIAEILALKDEAFKHPVTTALNYEAKLTALEEQLIKAVVAAIETVDEDVAYLVEYAMGAISDIIAKAEAAGTEYANWFAGRYEVLAGELLTLVIEETSKLGTIAAGVVYDMIVDFVNDALEGIGIPGIPNIDLKALYAEIDSLKATIVDIRNQITALKDYTGDGVDSMIDVLETELTAAEKYLAALNSLAVQIENLVNEIENEPELTVERVQAIVAEAKEIIAATDAIIGKLQTVLAVLAEVYADVIPAIIEAVENSDGPIKVAVDVTVDEIEAFAAELESACDKTLEAVETAVANLTPAAEQAVAVVTRAVAEAVAEITAATITAATEITGSVDTAIYVIKEEAAKLEESTDEKIATAAKEILAIVDAIALETSKAKIEAMLDQIEGLVQPIVDDALKVETMEEAEAVYKQAIEVLEQLTDIAEAIYDIVKEDVDKNMPEVKTSAEQIKTIVVASATNIGADAVAAYTASANAVCTAAVEVTASVTNAVTAYETAVVDAAGMIIPVVSDTAAEITNEVIVVVETATEEISAVAEQAASGASTIADAWKNVLYDATHFDYTVTEDSYYVSLGDSTVTGMNAANGTNPVGYENFGYKTVVKESFPYKLADELNVDYIQLGLAGLRTSDLLYVLDENASADEYMLERNMERVDNYAGGIDAMREDYVEELAKADLITLSIGNCNITDYISEQAYGRVAEVIRESKDLKNFIESPLGAEFKPIIEEYLDLGASTYALAWENYLDDEGMEIHDMVMAEVISTLEENDIPETYTLDLGAMLKPMLEEMSGGTVTVDIKVNIPVQDIIADMAETYAYACLAHVYDYPKVVDKIHELAPDAQLVLVGMYNPMDDLVITIGDLDLPVGEYAEYFFEAFNLNALTSALLNADTTYVSVIDAESNTDVRMDTDGSNGKYALEDYIISYVEEAADFHATDAGHTYIKEQIIDAIERGYILGDIDMNGEVNTADAVYLLNYIMFGGNRFPMNYPGNIDFTRDGDHATDDAVYLLNYIMFGDRRFPIA